LKELSFYKDSRGNEPYKVKPVYNTNLWYPKLWLMLGGGGRYLEVALSYKNCNWDFKMVVAVGRWLLFGGGS